MNALAESCAAALIKFGVETSIVVPGACTSGEVSDEIVRIVDLPAGERPFRAHRSNRNGSEVVSTFWTASVTTSSSESASKSF